jgi:hypothetical protein
MCGFSVSVLCDVVVIAIPIMTFRRLPVETNVQRRLTSVVSASIIITVVTLISGSLMLRHEWIGAMISGHVEVCNSRKFRPDPILISPLGLGRTPRLQRNHPYQLSRPFARATNVLRLVYYQWLPSFSQAAD